MEAPSILQPDTLPDLDLILVKGGTFEMGSGDKDAFEDEQPVHKVKLADFKIAKYPVTQRLWKAVMGEDHNPSFFKGDLRPVEQISWEDTQVFIQQLNEQSGKKYRLPTEAEWEYAARGGNQSKGYTYAGSDQLKEVGWYSKNSHLETKPVGLKIPNELGLSDMCGNVDEWVEDHWHDNYKGAPTDGSAWVDRDKGSTRVIRGGGWIDDPQDCRSTYRSGNSPAYRYNTVGFRLVLSLQSVG